jgi:hypothetical protein
MEYSITVFEKRLSFSLQDPHSTSWFLPRYERRIHEPRVTNLFACFAQHTDCTFDVVLRQS